MFSITIDGTTYDVDVDEINIEGEFLYKFAERVNSGEFKSEAIGFFENQSILFRGSNNSDFVALYEELSTKNTDGNYNKPVEVFSPIGKYTFDMYPDKLFVKMKRYVDGAGNDWWGECLIKFIAVEKVR